jgi:uncharacterized membrane protein (UPF0127 family)
MHMSKSAWLTTGAATILFVGISVWVVMSAYSGPNKESQTQSAYLVGDTYCLQLDVARSPEKKRRGLSDRRTLAANEGMLFLYATSGRYGFWMKDMDFSIDIIWLDEDNRIVTIKGRAQPESYPQTFEPDQPAKKIIETPAGWTQKQNINSGDQLTLVGPTTTTPVVCGSD